MHAGFPGAPPVVLGGLWSCTPVLPVPERDEYSGVLIYWCVSNPRDEVLMVNWVVVGLAGTVPYSGSGLWSLSPRGIPLGT
jgi:hypothetical protein